MLQLLALGVALAAPTSLDVETLTLPNGMTVILHPDERLPQVVISTWFGVGSKDEAPGRTGFAHLFEHLMFMGTKRVPGNQFDVLMETGGGANNAYTSEDRTVYFSWGPSSILPLLLWLDADRFEALAKAMTEKKVDLQRDVVRNERRQSYENTPYGAAELVVPETMYPPEHPYHHPVIGSHADLQAASLEDVKAFFETHYVPANATLVIAGRFDPAAVKPLVAQLFGALATKPVAPPPRPEPVRLTREIRRVTTDRVELPKLDLVWHAPAAYAPGTAELQLLASILAEGPASRLEQRLVQQLRLAESVTAYLDERLLGSLFRIEVTGQPGVDLERVKHETLAVIAELAERGPTQRELARVQAKTEVEFLEHQENLLQRANQLAEYHLFLGEADGFDRDLARYVGAGIRDLRDAARGLGEGRLDLRVLPRAASAGNIPSERPRDFAKASFTPPAPEVFRLRNGIEVRFVPQPGTGLFAGELVMRGGATAVPAEKAGLAALGASLLTSGAAGKSAPAFAEAVEALGGSIETGAVNTATYLGFSGLAAKLEPMLDLVADALLRPNLAAPDFEREKGLLLARVEARDEQPAQVAQVAVAAALYGADDPRGRPVEGFARTVKTLTLEDVRAAMPRLVSPRGATLVIVGDVERAALEKALEARFARWQGAGEAVPEPKAVTAAPAGRIVLVDRPSAPQTVIVAARPAATVSDEARVVRDAVNILFGGSFTSRLNQNLREKHGYTYGAGSRFVQDGEQVTLLARTSVQTEVTGAALRELEREFTALATGQLGEAEVAKARETAANELVESFQTTTGLAAELAAAALEHRPADALTRRARAIAGIDLARASAEARAGLHRWADLTIVLVGDRDAIVPQLAKAGFPAPVLADAEGKIVAAGERAGR